MRTLVVISLVVSQFTILPFFNQLAAARTERGMILQSGMNVVYKTEDQWPDWLQKKWSYKL